MRSGFLWMNLLIPFLLCFSLTIGKYSYFYKCYRFDVRMDELGFS